MRLNDDVLKKGGNKNETTQRNANRMQLCNNNNQPPYGNWRWLMLTDEDRHIYSI